MEDETGNLRPALVGRQREAALLWSRFETAISERCNVTCVTGEPGIGKTRLLEEMAARAARSGAVVLWGGASVAEGMPPYLPFLEALGQYIQVTAPDRLRDQVGPAAFILVTILPELGVHLGEFSNGYPLPTEQARLRLFETVGGFLTAIAASAPGGLLLASLTGDLRRPSPGLLRFRANGSHLPLHLTWRIDAQIQRLTRIAGPEVSTVTSTQPPGR